MFHINQQVQSFDYKFFICPLSLYGDLTNNVIQTNYCLMMKDFVFKINKMYHRFVGSHLRPRYITIRFGSDEW
jgi:hypothetical protein